MMTAFVPIPSCFSFVRKFIRTVMFRTLGSCHNIHSPPSMDSSPSKVTVPDRIWQYRSPFEPLKYQKSVRCIITKESNEFPGIASPTTSSLDQQHFAGILNKLLSAKIRGKKKWDLLDFHETKDGWRTFEPFQTVIDCNEDIRIHVIGTHARKTSQAHIYVRRSNGSCGT